VKRDILNAATPPLLTFAFNRKKVKAQNSLLISSSLGVFRCVAASEMIEDRVPIRIKS